MSKPNETILISKIQPTEPMHPLWLFLKIADHLNISEVEIDTRYESLVYTFYIFKTEATQELCDTLNLVAEITNDKPSVKCKSSLMEVSYIYSKKGNECLQMRSFYQKILGYDFRNKKFEIPDEFSVSKNNYPDLEIHVYDKGIAWNFTPKKYQAPKGFPCSMKDFFYYQDSSNVEHEVFYTLFKAWGEVYPIWKDLAEDFKAGCIYSSIPLPTIFESHSRSDLLQKYYKTSLKRNNKEDIGHGIFYIRASRIVEANDLQKLYGCKLIPWYIGRSKKDMVGPLAYVIYEDLKSRFPEMTIILKRRGKEEKFSISKTLIQDGIRMSIDLKKKVPLTFHSLKTVKEWHDELAITQRNKTLPVVNIPKDSRFKTLKMPENCIRLTNRRMFAEEGNFQNNCVASYIWNVNRDICSIWSMRKEDGRRNTIEICIRTSKDMPEGYFYIQQMYGFGNCEVSDEEYNMVRDCIKTQVPYSKKKSKNHKF